METINLMLEELKSKGLVKKYNNDARYHTLVMSLKSAFDLYTYDELIGAVELARIVRDEEEAIK